MKSAPNPELLLKRPLGRPAPLALVDRIVPPPPPPRRSIVNAIVAAAEETPPSGGVRDRETSRPRTPPVPVAQHAPSRSAKYSKPGILAGQKAGRLPPQIPHKSLIPETLQLLGEVAKAAKLRVSRKARLELLIGCYPFDSTTAAVWKSELKQLLATL